MSRHRRRIWPWILLLASASAGGGWWWTQRQNAHQLPPEYETVACELGDISKTVRASGDVNPLSKVEIGSQISGTINTLLVDFNSKVKAGDVLCKLDPATYEASYMQAMAEKVSAEADRDYQQKNLDRKKQLLEQKLYPQADYDKADADFKSAAAQLMLAEARLLKAKVDLERCSIVAPIDGIITDRTAEIGQTIAASFNAPKLFILANDLTKMQINAKVSEADIGQVKEGQKVEFNVDAYEDDFSGEVVQVRNSPLDEENVVNYDAIISVNNNELKLKPGMTAVVKIITAERKNVLRLPNAALRFKPTSVGPEPRSDRKKGGSEPKDKSTRKLYITPASPTDPPQAVEVTVGITDGVTTEILGGLKEGDKIISMLKPPIGAAPASNPFGGGMGRR